MSLLEDIRDEQAQQRKGPRCQVCLVLGGMSEQDRADLEAALADTSLFSTVIERALSRRGITVRDNAISRHRNGRCLG